MTIIPPANVSRPLPVWFWPRPDCPRMQSSVTLYGVVDAGILYTTKAIDPKTGLNAGHQVSMVTGGMTPSLFGLKGAEDLGGGVKALFTLESGIDVSNGGYADSNGNLFGRQAWVGIESNYGTVKAGVQFSPFVLSLIATDARSVSYFGSGVPIYVGGVLVTGIFNANAISYTAGGGGLAGQRDACARRQGRRFPGGPPVFREPQLHGRAVARQCRNVQRQLG